MQNAEEGWREDPTTSGSTTHTLQTRHTEVVDNVFDFLDHVFKLDQIATESSQRRCPTEF